MQASLHYQVQQLELPDFAIAPDDSVELQLASAMAWISELKSGKCELEKKLLNAARKAEIKDQLLRNAEIRERELQIELEEYGRPRASFVDRMNQACDQTFTSPADFDSLNCIGRMRNVYNSYATSFVTWTKSSEVRRLAFVPFKAPYRQLLRQYFPNLYRTNECPAQKL